MSHYDGFLKRDRPKQHERNRAKLLRSIEKLSNSQIKIILTIVRYLLKHYE